MKMISRSGWTARVATITPREHANADERTVEFHSRHDWRVNVQSVRRLAEDAKEGPIFLCGAVQNEVEVWEYFERAILLSVDEETIRQRIRARTSNDFGKSDLEVEMILGWNQDIETAYAGYGAAIVDARRSLKDVVEEILEVATGPLSPLSLAALGS